MHKKLRVLGNKKGYYEPSVHWGLGIRIVQIPRPPFSDSVSEQISSEVVWIPPRASVSEFG